MTDTQTSTAPAQPEKQTVAQKVAELQARKSVLAGSIGAMAEGAEKSAAQEEIAVIDRKLRWYAGRDGKGKVAEKTARPSKSRSKKVAAPASPAAPVTPAPASPANES